MVFGLLWQLYIIFLIYLAVRPLHKLSIMRIANMAFNGHGKWCFPECSRAYPWNGWLYWYLWLGWLGHDPAHYHCKQAWSILGTFGKQAKWIFYRSGPILTKPWKIRNMEMNLQPLKLIATKNRKRKKPWTKLITLNFPTLSLTNLSTSQKTATILSSGS